MCEIVLLAKLLLEVGILFGEPLAFSSDGSFDPHSAGSGGNEAESPFYAGDP